MSLERRKPLRAKKALARGESELRRKKPLRTTKASRTTKVPDAAAAQQRARGRRAKRAERGGFMGIEEWRALVLSRAGFYCEARLEGCRGTATEAHHRYRPGRPNTPANGVALCSDCHTGSAAAVHRNETWACRVGLLVPSSAGAPPAERWIPPPGEWRDGRR